MRLIFVLLLAALAHSASATASPLVIAHRGASGERPEHTLAAYERAIDQGADYIEPDLVATKDLVLIARHETDLSDTTDIAARPEFAGRKRTRDIEGRLVTGWFAEDLTLAEIRTLRAKERLPALRPSNARFDGLYAVPTFTEVVTLVRAKEAETGRRIGLYPELKHPTLLLEQSGIDMVDLLATALRKEGLADPDDLVFVQSFEVEPLRRLDRLIGVPLIQLLAAEGGPYDRNGVGYAEMATPAGLAEIARYADGIGPALALVLKPDGSATPLVRAARDAGMKVHAWTVRKENAFFPPALQTQGGPAARGDIAGLIRQLTAAGVDGVFTDDPALVVSLVRAPPR
ncbi:glycerophosphodiester phosphodiesterase family protein [Qipengyuania sediminis]|uniref:glycerophosphodiester phosphodiesterase family protein n=1 Tax=Qipengyuania sediminis TaxID=1532023 RepID=UPI00105AAEF3|nr:glycerophosphodiester phosphodiesterase family protein [Qipengyuania sediminis]